MYIYHVPLFYKTNSLHKVKISGSSYTQDKETYYCNRLLGYNVYYTISVSKRSYVVHLDTVHGPFDFFLVHKVRDRYRYLDKLIVESNQPDFTSVVIDFEDTLVSACTYHYIPIGDYHILILVLYYNRGAGNHNNIDNNAVGCIAFLYHKGILLAKNSFYKMSGSDVIAGNILRVICYYITEFVLPGITTPRGKYVDLEGYTCECSFWIQIYLNSHRAMLIAKGFNMRTLFLHALVPSVGLYDMYTGDSPRIICTIYHKDNLLYRFIGSKQIIYDIYTSKEKALYKKAKSNVSCFSTSLEPIEIKSTKTVKIEYYFDFLNMISAGMLYEVVHLSKNFQVLGVHKLIMQNSCYVIAQSKVIENYLFLKNQVKSYNWRIVGNMNIIVNKAKPYFLMDINNREVLEPDKVFELNLGYGVYEVFIFNKKKHVELILLQHGGEILKIELKGDYGKMFLDVLERSFANYKPIRFLRDGERAIVVAESDNSVIVFRINNSVIHDAFLVEGNYDVLKSDRSALLITIKSDERTLFYLLDADGIVYETDDTWIRNIRKDKYDLYINFYGTYLILGFAFGTIYRLTYVLFIDFTERNNVKIIKGMLYYSSNHIKLIPTLNNGVLIFTDTFKKVIRVYENVRNLVVSDEKILSVLSKVNNSKYQVDLKYDFRDGLLIMKFNDLVTMSSNVV